MLWQSWRRAVSLPFALGSVGHTNQGSGRVEMPVTVGPRRSDTELPDSRDSFVGQHDRAELFGECLSHAREINANPFQTY
jgi:hypothetical protein